MDKVIVIAAGVLCGIGQFFIMRYTLAPLSKGREPQVVLGLLLRLPVPLGLLLGCAWYNADLLPLTAGAFCVSTVAATAIHHKITR